MTGLTYNDIFDAVCAALHEMFPKANIYGETVKQGIVPGDFNVLPITASHDKELGARSRRSLTFDVIYYPNGQNSAEERAECLKIALALPEVLTTIPTRAGCNVGCTSFESTITDDVLHCIVKYPHFVYTPNDMDKMETLAIKN